MKVYLFNVYSKDYGWKPIYCATELEAEIDHGEYVKYCEQEDHVTDIIIVKFTSPADLCEHLNKLSSRLWD